MVIAKYHHDNSKGNGNGNINGTGNANDNQTKASSPWQWYDGEYGDHEYDEAMQNIIIVGTLLMALVMSLKKVVEEDSEGKLGWYWTMEVTQKENQQE